MSTTVHAPQPAAPTSAPTFPPPQPEDRTQLDSRRVIARAIDGMFAGAPLLIPVLGLGAPLSIVLVAISLTYFFVCEAVWGQTIGKRIIGLRVLMADGGPATATAVAARTVLRIVEDGPLGLIAFLGSGKRRQRLGDLLGGTIVVRPTPGLRRAGFSPLLLAYPAALACATVALFLALAGPQARHDYLRAVDKTCAERTELNAATRPKGLDLDAIVARKRADHRALAAVGAPDAARRLQAEILTLDERVGSALAAVAANAKGSRNPQQALRAGIKPVAAARQVAAKRYAQLGMRNCAGQTT